MEPDKLMDSLSKELTVALKAMAKTKNVDEKEAYSRIVKNLCESFKRYRLRHGGGREMAAR